MPTPPKKTSKKKITSKKTASAKVTLLAPDTALRVLRGTHSAADALVHRPTLTSVRAWFATALHDFERSAGPKAHPTVEFANVINRALASIAGDEDSYEARGVLGKAVGSARGVLTEYLRSLADEVKRS